MGAQAQDGWLPNVMGRLQAEATDLVGVENHLDIAGRAVRIRYSGPALAAAMGRATRHLKVAEPRFAVLTIECWTAPDPEPQLPIARSGSGMSVADDGDVVLTWDAQAGPLVAYDRTRRHGWVRFGSLADVSPWERATPFASIVHWWAADQGLQLVHAAAVGHADGGLLLVGRSGSGKSTTSLACLQAGLGFVGDDYCLLTPGDRPRVHGLYLSAKGDARTATLLPGFRADFACAPNTLNGKSVLFTDQVQPDGICTGFPLLGIVVPRITGEHISRLSPISPAAALRALAPSTVFQMPGNRAGGLARLASTVRHLPAWELTLGPDPATAADLIKELIDGQVSR